MAEGRQWDVEVDVISVGSGLGGLTAAIVAHDRGAEALVLEKADKLGGVSALSVGVLWVPGNHKMADEGVNDPLEDGLRYARFLSSGLAEEELLAQLIDKGREAARYLEERAFVKWQIVKDLPDSHYPHAPGAAHHGRYLEARLFPGSSLGAFQHRTYSTSPHQTRSATWGELLGWGGLAEVKRWDFSTIAERGAQDIRGGGAALMGYLAKAALVDRGIPAYTRTRACDLVVEGGAVIGVRAERDGRDLFVRARRGVVLAVGGYDWRPDFTRYYEGLSDLKSMCPPHIEGDNIVLGGAIGATIAGVPSHNLGMYFGYHIPGEEHEGKPLWRASWESGLPHAIWVNRAGKRFCMSRSFGSFCRGAGPGASRSSAT